MQPMIIVAVPKMQHSLAISKEDRSTAMLMMQSGKCVVTEFDSPKSVYRSAAIFRVAARIPRLSQQTVHGGKMLPRRARMIHLLMAYARSLYPIHSHRPTHSSRPVHSSSKI